MSIYIPPVTPTYVIDRVILTDIDTVALRGKLPGVGAADVDMEGPNLGSTYGIRFRDHFGGNHLPTSVEGTGDGGLLVTCTGVAAGWRFYSSIGNPSFLSKEGFECAGSIRKVSDS